MTTPLRRLFNYGVRGPTSADFAKNRNIDNKSFLKFHFPNGLVDGEDFISFNLNNLHQKLDYIYDNRDKVDKIRFNGKLKLHKGFDIEKILSDMKGVKGWKRRARFKCCLMLKLNRSLEPIKAEGFLEGLIAEVPKGERGFGYDPIFLLPNLGLSLAEITKEKKNEISHRSKAFILLLKKLSLINY